MNMVLKPTAIPIDELHSKFLTMLPRIVAVASFGFRHFERHDREECLAEAVALSWKWFVRLAELNRLDKAYATALAGFAVKQVRTGRGVAGQPTAKDAMNTAAQRRFGFQVEPLFPSSRKQFAQACRQPSGQRHLDAWEEMLTDNTQTPVDQQAQFRIDWPAWLTTRSNRDRRLIGDLSIGERTGELAEKYRLSPARISQKRREYHMDWHRFSEGLNRPSPRRQSERNSPTA